MYIVSSVVVSCFLLATVYKSPYQKRNFLKVQHGVNTENSPIKQILVLKKLFTDFKTDYHLTLLKLRTDIPSLALAANIKPGRERVQACTR